MLLGDVKSQICYNRSEFVYGWLHVFGRRRVRTLGTTITCNFLYFCLYLSQIVRSKTCLAQIKTDESRSGAMNPHESWCLALEPRPERLQVWNSQNWKAATVSHIYKKTAFHFLKPKVVKHQSVFILKRISLQNCWPWVTSALTVTFVLYLLHPQMLFLALERAHNN